PAIPPGFCVFARETSVIRRNDFREAELRNLLHHAFASHHVVYDRTAHCCPRNSQGIVILADGANSCVKSSAQQTVLQLLCVIIPSGIRDDTLRISWAAMSRPVVYNMMT